MPAARRRHARPRRNTAFADGYSMPHRLRKRSDVNHHASQQAHSNLRRPFPDGNVVPVQALSEDKDLAISPKTLSPYWGGEVMDYNYAQGSLEPCDRDDP